MSDELKAAVERLRLLNVDYDYELVYGSSFQKAREQLHADRFLLSEAYVNNIDEQERIAAERALPIGVEWLVSIGFAVHAETSFTYKHIELHRTESGEWHCWIRSALGTHACYLADAIQTQGDMLDLLAALKIETKGM